MSWFAKKQKDGTYKAENSAVLELRSLFDFTKKEIEINRQGQKIEYDESNKRYQDSINRLEKYWSLSGGPPKQNQYLSDNDYWKTTSKNYVTKDDLNEYYDYVKKLKEENKSKETLHEIAGLLKHELEENKRLKKELENLKKKLELIDSNIDAYKARKEIDPYGEEEWEN